MSFDLDINAAGIDTTTKFGVWKNKFGKSFSSAADEAHALAAFAKADARIVSHNAKNSTYKLGHNEFSGLEWEEFKGNYVGDSTGAKAYMSRERKYDLSLKSKADAAPRSLDWSTDGAVTPIKNQGQCGSCWAFSTTGAVEGAYQVGGGDLTSLSEQMLVDCDTTDQGCNGGLMDNAFSWIESNGGICTEDSYPYTGVTGTCSQSANCAKAVTVSDYSDVTPNDEDALKAAVAIGPVSVAIEADQSVFQSYTSGILDSTGCGTNLDHGVLVVGYGTQMGQDYWKVKNSWGETWGMDGYILMARGDNTCGISMEPSYPTGVSGPGATDDSAPAADDDDSTPSTDDSAGSTHYSDPNDGGCLSDEINIQITGVDGSCCSATCTTAACPTDVPSGVTAGAQCALQNAGTGDKYCALICAPTTDEKALRAGDAQCGDKASCKASSGTGICTYDSR